jgi:hypothetical protein
LETGSTLKLRAFIGSLRWQESQQRQRRTLRCGRRDQLWLSPKTSGEDYRVSDYQITAVETVQPVGAAHEHVENVFIRDSFWLSKNTVCKDLRAPGGDTYFTSVYGHRADVIVVGCPMCGFRDYLRTKADDYLSNNLLKLPRKHRAA